MKSLFLFGRRCIGYLRSALTGVRCRCMSSIISVSSPLSLRYALHILTAVAKFILWTCFTASFVVTTAWHTAISQKLYKIIRAYSSCMIPSYFLLCQLINPIVYFSSRKLVSSDQRILYSFLISSRGNSSLGRLVATQTYFPSSARKRTILNSMS